MRVCVCVCAVYVVSVGKCAVPVVMVAVAVVVRARTSPGMLCTLLADAEPVRCAVLRALDPACRLALRRASRTLLAAVPACLCVPSVRRLVEHGDAALLRGYDAALRDGYYRGGAHRAPGVHDVGAAVEADNADALAWMWARGAPLRLGEYPAVFGGVDYNGLCRLAACGARHRALALLCDGDCPEVRVDDRDLPFVVVLEAAPSDTASWFLRRYAARFRPDAQLWQLRMYMSAQEAAAACIRAQLAGAPAQDLLALLALAYGQRRVFEELYGALRAPWLGTRDVLLCALSGGDLEAASLAAAAGALRDVTPTALLCAAASVRADAVRALEWAVTAMPAAAAVACGQTPSGSADGTVCVGGPDASSGRPMACAAETGSLDAMLWLEARGLDVVSGWPLRVLIERGHVAALSHLLHRRPRAGVSDPATLLDPTHMYAAVGAGRPDVLEVVLDATGDTAATRGTDDERVAFREGIQYLAMAAGTPGGDTMRVLLRRRLLPEPPQKHCAQLVRLVGQRSLTAANLRVLADAGYWPPDRHDAALDVSMAKAARQSGNEELVRALDEIAQRQTHGVAGARDSASGHAVQSDTNAS